LYQKEYIDRILPIQRQEALKTIYKATDHYTDGWLSMSEKILQLINKRATIINVLVSSGQLIPTLSKLLLYGLAKYFPVDNVYSSRFKDKEWCFKKIIEKFTSSSTIIVIGDGVEEERASKSLQLKFIKIKDFEDLNKLYNDLKENKI